MNNPLEGLDAQERDWLAKIAKNEGLTLEQARERRDQFAKRLSETFRQAAEKRGISEEEIEKECESERRMIEFIYNTTGVKFPGRFSIAAAADSGERVLTGASRAHVKTHGSEKDKSERWADYQTRLEEKMARNPRLSVTEARRRVAQDVGVAHKTVERHTKDPRKK